MHVHTYVRIYTCYINFQLQQIFKVYIQLQLHCMQKYYSLAEMCTYYCHYVAIVLEDVCQIKLYIQRTFNDKILLTHTVSYYFGTDDQWQSTKISSKSGSKVCHELQLHVNSENLN